MLWLPDTNVWIRLLKEPGSLLEQRVLSHRPEELRICSVIKAELWHGAYKYGRTDRRMHILEQLFAGLISLPFDDESAWYYGAIRHHLEIAGCVIGPNDLKIAAICRAYHLTLVTANTDEFARVPDLLIEDWSV